MVLKGILILFSYFQSRQRTMKQIGSSQLELFAKLSKILAETFEDIHKICLRQAGELEKQTSSINHERHMTAKELWLQKREQAKIKENEHTTNRVVVEEQPSKPPKSKKMKAKPSQHNGEHNGSRQKRHEKKKKVAKWQQEGKPRPPLNAFMLFLKDSKVQIMEAKPQLTPSQVSSYASALWNELNQQQKQKYRSEYRESRLKYDQQLKQFNEKERLSGKVPSKPSKKSQKVGKDILDEQLIDIQQSSSEQSMSGI